MDCIFCKIAAHDIPAKTVFENERLIAFHDLFPQAPVHVLIIPKVHFSTLNDVPQGESALLGEMMSTATTIARELGLADDGYRLVMNCGANGGQSVFHIHLHLLAGRQMSWPPG
ncbi:MAG: histidine triad nucleotide-binding protein [Moraxellaceae bacterium]|nr:histidine triad nucleotide-binding protein [Moraxellaceae bacterium]